MRKTKIVCTMGPSTDKPGILRQLMENGMNVARFNFSHGDYEEHKGRFDKVRALSKELDLPIACMLDTKGPEIRLGEFKNTVEKLVTGQKFTLTSRNVEGTNEICSVTYKDLMKKYGIPTAKYETFDDPAKVMDYIRAEGKYPVVIKADGLALGKGVLICENEQQAADGVKEIMLDKKFGASGNHVVVEEFLTGPEVSVLSFTDGKVVKPMVSSMDHKRANDHDTGLNTGGMGTIAPNPYYTPEVAAECMEKIFLPTIRAMNAEGCPFKGCLYFGLMLTPDGPKVIEYNCRFGDPETQVVLPLLESDLLHIMQACTDGTLAQQEVEFSDGAAACVILASGGYPVAYEKGKPISGLVDGQLPDEENVTVYHSGTAITEDGQLVTNGGRVLGVTATGPRLTNALSHAYEAAEKISFEKLHKRSDIGLRALKALAEKQ